MESRADVLIGYLDYFRSRVLAKIEGMPEVELRRSRLPSGWTPMELLKHLTFVEIRWLEWRFGGDEIADPWGDRKDDRWHVPSDERLEDLVAGLRAQASRSRAIISGSDLGRSGVPGPNWNGPAPATLERIGLHLIQEYARHLGHLDIVAELTDGEIGE
jgi:hypothetical protein